MLTLARPELPGAWSATSHPLRSRSVMSCSSTAALLPSYEIRPAPGGCQPAGRGARLSGFRSTADKRRLAGWRLRGITGRPAEVEFVVAGDHDSQD